MGIRSIPAPPPLPPPLHSNTPQSVGVYVYILGQALLGNICPNMSISPFQQCVKGFYCPDPSKSISCPEDYYCKV